MSRFPPIYYYIAFLPPLPSLFHLSSLPSPSAPFTMGYPPSLAQRNKYWPHYKPGRHPGTASARHLPNPALHRSTLPPQVPNTSNPWWIPQCQLPAIPFAPAIPDSHWPLPLPLDISATLQPLPREGLSSPANTSIVGSNSEHLSLHLFHFPPTHTFP